MGGLIPLGGIGDGVGPPGWVTVGAGSPDWEKGDLVIWDNRCTFHRRDKLDPSQKRLMHRTQIADDYPPTAPEI